HLPDREGPLAQRLGLDVLTFRQKRRAMLDRLLDARGDRPRPLLDDKVLADWNGLMIASLATAARVLDRDDYAEAASGAAAFVLREMRLDDGRLLHRWRDGEAAVDGYLDDYAFLAWGLIELSQATGEAAHLRTALDLHSRMRDLFEDPEGGYFLTQADARGLLVRQKALDDGALPSGNAIAALNGIRLAHLTGDAETEAAAHAALRADARIRAHPTGHAAHLLAAQVALGPAPEIVIASGDGADAMREAIDAVYAPGAWHLTQSEPLVEIAPFTAHQTARDGRATAYVCERGACQAPTTDPEVAADALAALYAG
ncbi:MAG: thioredoxin domain-containing protein, partial [Bacteroidota bacterium]